ncbi:MAG: hypothetical protein ABI538_06540 [Pseudoxanthomonas sp.]
MLQLLQADEVDAAIEAGLMHYVPCPLCDRALTAELTETKQKLATAWAARDRYQARNARLARRTAQREAKRSSAIPEKKSALPAAAAAILARAKARAAERGKQ